MPNANWKPWWDKPNDYLIFEDREEFIRGALGYKPNNKQNMMVALLSAGYVNGKFAQSQSLGKRSNAKAD
jgi:hypothetical protein